MKNSNLLIVGAVVIFAAAASAGTRYAPFTSVRRTFSCDVPADWPPFEEETPDGSAVHLLGPAEADGAFRAAIHIHFVDKKRPGAASIATLLKQERRSDAVSGRSATPAVMWRLAGGRARRFEVTETRQLPGGLLPSRPVALHHYYALAPAGDGCFIIKLSSTRETYLDHREAFEHLLNTFTIIGYQ